MAKICFIASSLFSVGGEQRVAAVVANELVKSNRIIAYTMDGEAEREKNIYGVDGRIEIREIRQPRFGLPGRAARRIIRELNERTPLLYRRKCFYGLLEYAYFCKAWQKQWIAELAKERYDVIVAVSGGNTMRLGLIADRLDCGMTVGWEHNAYEAYFEMKSRYFWHMDPLFAESLRRLDKCVVLNRDIAEKYKTAFGKDCDVIYNPRSFVCTEKSSLAEKNFVTCGRMIRQKGFDLLIESFRSFARDDKEWTLTIVGDGDMRPFIEGKIAEYRLNDRVTITGYTKEVRKYLKEASVYLLPSRWEGFPMVLTEAFETGLPVVAYDIPAVEPLLTDQREGLLAAAYDTEAFAGKMREMAGLSMERKRQMAEAAMKMADSLDAGKIAAQWKRLLGAE